MKEIHSLSHEVKLYDDLKTQVRYKDDATPISMSFDRLGIVSSALKEAHF